MQLIVNPTKNLNATITVPGDKSISHRAVMLASLTQAKSHISGWLPAGDCQATLKAMQSLGVQIEVLTQSETQAELVVHGVGYNGLKSPLTPIDCQGSGTTMRLLAGILAGQALTITLDGHEGLRRRPMARIARPLRQMGAEVSTTDGRPPITITGGPLTAIDYTMPIPSGQVKSAVLLAALFAKGQTTIRQPGSARDHTERLLTAQGVQVNSQNNVIQLNSPTQPLLPFNLTIPGDFSSAAFPMVAALIVPNSQLTIKNVNTNPTRTGLFDLLQTMQATIKLNPKPEMAGEPQADLIIQSSSLKSTAVQGDLVVRMIDEFPIFAVAATQAHGTTVIRDAAELRLKETDRIKATVVELRKMGGQLIAHPDGFEVHGPTPLNGTIVNSHGDHRLAMALAVAGLIAKGQTCINNAQVIADSYPGFVSMLNKIGATVILK